MPYRSSACRWPARPTLPCGTPRRRRHNACAGAISRDDALTDVGRGPYASIGMTFQSSTQRRLLRLVHTADVHIGDDLDPGRRLAGLHAVVDATLEHQAHALLIAGDLFDNARIKEHHARQAIDELARLRIPVLVSNGNHDALQPPSIYERVRLADAGAHVYFLDHPDGSHVTLPQLHLTVWARAMLEHDEGFNPLLGYTTRDEGHWQVILAHGHYFAAGHKPDRSSPLLQEHIGDLTCDYLALGHWHRYLDVSHDGTPAFYPGSPSEAGGTFPSANLVTLDPQHGTTVERIATGV